MVDGKCKKNDLRTDAEMLDWLQATRTDLVEQDGKWKTASIEQPIYHSTESYKSVREAISAAMDAEEAK